MNDYTPVLLFSLKLIVLSQGCNFLCNGDIHPAYSILSLIYISCN